MGIGGSIFLIALGAILAFGVNADLGWLDLDVVGFVLMLSGLAGLMLTFHFWNRRRRAVTERHYYNGRATPAPTVTEEAVPVERTRVQRTTTTRRAEPLD